MEGRPLLRILLIVLGFSLVGWPIWSVTHGASVPSPAKPASAARAEPLRVQVTFASPPASFELDYLGKTLLSGHAPDREFSGDWKVAIPKEGVELFVAAKLPPGTPATAVRLSLTRDGTPLAEQTFWADGSLAETMTVREAQP